MPQVGQIVARIGVAQRAAPGIEDGVEASDKHARWYVGQEHFINLCQYTPRLGTPSLGDGAKDALGVGHHQRCRNTMAGGVTNDQSQPTIFYLEKVVEVSSHLPGWLVEGCDLPSLQVGHLLGQGGLLDASGHLEFVFYALALDSLLLQTLLRQLCETASLAPLLSDLACHYAVD